MTPQTKARLIAAIALALLAPDVSPAHAASIDAASCITPVAVDRMPHISIETRGAASDPAIILIPGLSSPMSVWDGILPTLAKNHRVILVQVNGFGGDDPGANLKPGILDGVVADLDTYIARNKLNSAAVIGHSMGGLVAMMLAKAHPGDVGKLMIVDSLPYIGLLFSPAATVPLVEPQAKMMRDRMAAGYGKPADPAFADATANRLALKPGSRATVKAWMMVADPRVSAEAFYEDMTTDVRADLPQVAAPITLVYPVSADGSDKPKSEAMYRSAYAGAPHVTFVDVADSAHFVMLDQPEAFAKVVMAFLGS